VGQAASETIHISTPLVRTPGGQIAQGEQFGIVEARVSAVLGPLMGKGLLRCDAKVMRGNPNVRVIAARLFLRVILHELDRVPFVSLRRLYYPCKSYFSRHKEISRLLARIFPRQT
jgi:hypothetical protein